MEGQGMQIHKVLDFYRKMPHFDIILQTIERLTFIQNVYVYCDYFINKHIHELNYKIANYALCKVLSDIFLAIFDKILHYGYNDVFEIMSLLCKLQQKFLDLFP